MIKFLKPKRNLCRCLNCGYAVQITPENVKERTFEYAIATYIECPVCGEKILKQLDTEETQKLAEKGVFFELLKRQGKRLSERQKRQLKSIEKTLFNTRSELNKRHWEQTYQSLNPFDEDEKTEMADQEPTLGNQVTSTVNAGEGERTCQ